VIRSDGGGASDPGESRRGRGNLTPVSADGVATEAALWFSSARVWVQVQKGSP
jgi:hypothetical protein